MEDRGSMRIGLFGGTFDPPHNGHIHLILSLIEAHHLDRVLIVPAQSNPLKPPQAPPEHRLQMARLAFGSVPGCTILDIEMCRPGPSYTIDTIVWLIDHNKEFAAAEKFLLLGADAASTLPKWHQVDRILALVRPLVATRPGFEGPSMAIEGCLWPNAMPRRKDGPNKNRNSCNQALDISSTDLRSRIHRGLYVGHLVPERVVEYIRKFKLYI